MDGANVAAAGAAGTALLVKNAHVELSCHDCCPRDRVILSWSVPLWMVQGGEVAWVQIWFRGGNQEEDEVYVRRVDLFQEGFARAIKSPSSSLTVEMPMPELINLESYSVIHAKNSDTWKPFPEAPPVQSLQWSGETDRNHRDISITFTAPTNAPWLPSADSLNEAVSISYGTADGGFRRVMLKRGRGEWSDDGAELFIRGIDEDAWHDLISNRAAANDGGSSSIEIRAVVQREGGSWIAGREALNPAGEVGLRLPMAGRYTAKLLVGAEEVAASSRELILNGHCDDDVVIDMSSFDHHWQRERSRAVDDDVPLPLAAVGGVLAMMPGQWHSLPDPESLDWSCSAWIFPLQRAPGLAVKKQTLLFRRTKGFLIRVFTSGPSNILGIRVEQGREPRTAVISHVTIPASKWTHLGVSCSYSEVSQADKAVMVCRFHVNGAQSAVASIPLHPVRREEEEEEGRVDDRAFLWGAAPGEGNWIGGASFVSQLRLFDIALSDKHATREYQRTRKLLDFSPGESLSSQVRGLLALARGMMEINEISQLFAAEPPTGRAEDLFQVAVQATTACAPIEERRLLYEQAADENHPLAHVVLAHLMLAGVEGWAASGTTICALDRPSHFQSHHSPHFQEAVEHLRAGIRLGSHEAAFSLGLLILWGGELSKKDSIHPPAEVAAALWDLSMTESAATSLAVALFHAAAIGGITDAFLALGWRYRLGVGGVEADPEAAVFYLRLAAERASLAHHTPGEEPHISMIRLHHAKDLDVSRGERGSEDEAIRYQMIRASQEKHIPSILGLADLYYWGGRGMDRDQVEARRLFIEAAELGDDTGRVAAAGMFLKGEGGPANHTLAVEYYQAAAANGHVRALNGLGYEYFFGTGLEMNRTKAYEYFVEAARQMQDGDSVYNVGHCLTTGQGVERNDALALEYFMVGYHNFNHFDSAYDAGRLIAEGRGEVERDPARAGQYLLAAAAGGRSATIIGEAFQCFLQGDMACAVFAYSRAAEIGFEVAASNAAYILERASSHELPAAWTGKAALRFQVFAASQGYHPAYLRIADSFLADPLLRDEHRALKWYYKASAAGLPRGSYAVARMHELGLGTPENLSRALLLYDLVGKKAGDVYDEEDPGALPLQVLVQISKMRVRAKLVYQSVDDNALLAMLVALLVIVVSAWTRSRRRKSER
jgi:SEL1 protein